MALLKLVDDNFIPSPPPRPVVKKPKTIKILCVSDYSGRERYTIPLKQLHQDSAVELTQEILDDEATASLFEISWRNWMKYHREGYSGHTSHFLSKHGEELCLGDYLG